MGVDQETLAIDLQLMTKDDNEILTIEEARKIIQILKDRCRFQTHQALIWRKKAKIQEQHIARISSEYNTRLESLTSELLLFEARLSKKQREITELLDERDCIIEQQQQIIQCLHSRLADFGVTMTVTSLDDGNVDDSDSAVIMEEDEFSSQVDATEHLQSNQQNQQQPRPITTEDGRETDGRGNVTATYNRVMSNHRSVTKPKDVKYKRINKAKSKSLEELRGRLKNWVDRGTRMSLSVEPAYR